MAGSAVTAFIDWVLPQGLDQKTPIGIPRRMTPVASVALAPAGFGRWRAIAARPVGHSCWLAALPARLAALTA